MAQGLLGAVVALAVLEVAYRARARRALEPLLNLTLGLGARSFSPLRRWSLPLGGGATLGALGGLLATRGRPRHDGARPPCAVVLRLAARRAWRSRSPARPPGAKRDGADIGEKQQDLQQKQKPAQRGAPEGGRRQEARGRAAGRARGHREAAQRQAPAGGDARRRVKKAQADVGELPGGYRPAGVAALGPGGGARAGGSGPATSSRRRVVFYPDSPLR